MDTDDPTDDAPRLLARGNPRVPKGEGDPAVQGYIAAIPGWKQGVARRLDAVVSAAVPGVRKAVKWNSPFYGADAEGWFLSFHVYTRYLKLAFFRGASLRPLPPGASTKPLVRYLDIHEHDGLDEARLADWARQAAELPGWPY